MLQLILAFLAITIVSATGYSLVEQVVVHQKVLEQRENARRLDAVAKSIESNLIAVSGVNGIFAPAPGSVNGISWSTVPLGIKGITSSASGDPFLYCPVGRRTTNGNAGLPEIDMPSGSYKIEVSGGGVIASDLLSTYSSSGVVAFVIAFKQGSKPSCGDISFSGNRFSIPNGIVRPVYDGGSSTIGLKPGDTRAFVGSGVSIDQALAHWVSANPQTFDIVVSGDVVISDANVWSNFLSEISSRRSQLSFSAPSGSNASITFPSSYINISSNLLIRSNGGTLTFSGANLVIKQGGQLSTQGSVAIIGNSAAPAIAVEQGGRLNSSGSLAMTGLGGTVINGVLSAGDVSLSGADVSSNGQWSMSFATGGRLSTLNSVIGSSANSLASLLSAGAWSIVSDNSSQVRQSASGDCWKSVGSNDVTFAFSNNGVGASSSVMADNAAPTLSDPATPEELILFQEWRREVDGKQRSRQSNNSNFQCV